MGSNKCLHFFICLLFNCRRNLNLKSVICFKKKKKINSVGIKGPRVYTGLWALFEDIDDRENVRIRASQTNYDCECLGR